MKVPQTIKRWLFLVAGWTFILLGIAGLFLPVLPGILFLAIGLVILSSEYVWAHNLVQRLRARFPSFASHFDKATDKAQSWLGRMSADS